MSKRASQDRHALERLKERYDISLDAQGREELRAAVRKCRWLPLEIQGSRLRVLIKFRGKIIDLVFSAADIALVTARPFDLADIDPEQFDKVRLFFPELVSMTEAERDFTPNFPAIAAPAAKPPQVRPAPPKTSKPSLFDTAVMKRFGNDKAKANEWWVTPNPGLGYKTPAELAARGRIPQVTTYLEQSKKDKNGLPVIAKRKATAKANCKTCRGYAPSDTLCGDCEESDAPPHTSYP